MSLSWFDSPSGRPLVIAHRGGAALAAENTVEAFALAVAAGADAVETDVRLSADGALVCIHDADMLRLCGDPRDVADLDLATLRSLAPGMLTLDEAISASAPLGLLLDVKLTEASHLPAILDSVAKAGAGARTIVGLRRPELIAAARKLSGSIAILAFAADPDSMRQAADFGATWFRLWQGAADGARVAAVRAAGLRVAIMVGQPRSVPLPEYPPYPVGLVDDEGLARLRQLAPDAILLDDPRLLAR